MSVYHLITKCSDGVLAARSVPFRRTQSKRKTREDCVQRNETRLKSTGEFEKPTV